MVEAATSTRFDRFMGLLVKARVVYYVIGHTWSIHPQTVRAPPSQRHHSAGQPAVLTSFLPRRFGFRLGFIGLRQVFLAKNHWGDGAFIASPKSRHQRSHV